MYYQCKLQKGNAFLVTWLENYAADPGKIVQLIDDNGKDLGYWMVIEAYRKVGLTKKQLRDKQTMDRNCFASISG